MDRDKQFPNSKPNKSRIDWEIPSIDKLRKIRAHILCPFHYSSSLDIDARFKVIWKAVHLMKKLRSGGFASRNP